MSGLLALLDDVAAIAKVASASVDDIIGQASKAGAKAAGAIAARGFDRSSVPVFRPITNPQPASVSPAPTRIARGDTAAPRERVRVVVVAAPVSFVLILMAVPLRVNT